DRSSVVAEALAHGRSARTREASGLAGSRRAGGQGQLPQSGAAGEEARRDGPPLVVFVAGGICYSEEMKRDVTIGTTEMLTPTRFAAALSTLDANGSNV
ncbi:hypothetical protein T484DRAFT_1811524, partial [Baffinella frigidus]